MLSNERLVDCVDPKCERLLFYNGDLAKAVDLPCDGRRCTASVCFKCRKEGADTTSIHGFGSIQL